MILVSSSRGWSRWPARVFNFLLLLSLVTGMMVTTPAQPVQAISTTVVISQVYGGGGNTGAPYTNDFIELRNITDTPQSLSGMSIQWASQAGSTWSVTALSGTIPAGGYYLVQEAAGSSCSGSPCGSALPTADAAGTITMGSTSGKAILVQGTTAVTGACPDPAIYTIIDFLAIGSGASNCYSSGQAPANSNTTAVFRASNGCSDTDINATDFAGPRTPTPRNTSTSVPLWCTYTNPSGIGTATPGSGVPGDSVSLTVAVTAGDDTPSTGLAVQADLTTIGGSATQQLYDDATNGDQTAGDLTFSFDTTIGSNSSNGSLSLPFTITDDQGRAPTGTIGLTVDALPMVSSTVPITDATDVALSSNITVNFSEDVTTAKAAFALTCASGGSQDFDFSGTSATYTLDPVSNLPGGTSCTVTIDKDLVSDQDGTTNTLAEDYSWSFTTTSDVPPTVSSTVPVTGTTDVAVDSDIIVTFSEAVTAEAADFTINCEGETEAFGLTTSDSIVYTLTPSNPLPFNKACTVTIADGAVVDQDGTPDALTPAYSWNFTTAADTAPTVSSVSPANNATLVAVDANIAVTFSEVVTATASAFTLNCGDSDLGYSLSGYDTAVLTLDPTANLPYGKTCTVTAKAGQVTDRDGTVDSLAADYSWSFGTTYDPTGPTPIGVARAAGAGWSGTLRGNITVPTGIFATTYQPFVIQDSTGGIYVYATSTASLPNMALGDVVEVVGTIKLYNGYLEIDPLTTATWISAGTPPKPTATAIPAVASTQGLLIDVTGTAVITKTQTIGSDYSFGLSDGTTRVTIFVDKDTKIDATALTDGQTVRVIGFSTSYKGIPQVMPRYQSDIITDFSVPTVTGTNPADKATGVDLYHAITATFSKAMLPYTLDTTSFSLASSSGPVSGAVAYDDSTHTASFTPAAFLAPNTTYTATLSTAVMDSSYTPLAAAYQWSFTTGDADTTPPAITNRTPAPGATAVAVNSPVQVVFNEDLQTSGLSDNFSLASPYGAVAAMVSYDDATNTVNLDPADSLLPTTTYTVTVEAAVADLAGNSLGTASVWSFTTAAELPMQVYFGDLHNHTSYSDGSGTPVQALAAGKAAGFDFMAISDHSYAIDDTEWANTLTAVNDATGSDFVALRGFEYTQGAEGHINVWNSVRHAVRTNTGCSYCDYTPNLEAGATVQGFYPWLAVTGTVGLDASGTVMQFNHPGWINFNDWTYHPEVAGVARLNEVGNGSGASYVFAEDEYQRSLDYGWKLGATNNADTHSLYWGTNTDHRTGVVMPELTRAALLEAMRLRRTFATEDKNFSLTMKANGSWMGAEIANTGQIQFEIAGNDPDNELTSKVELITDQGKVLDTLSPNTASFNWSPLLSITTGVHYFYVKATQADGDLIVTSPVWTQGSEDIAITDIVIQPTIPTIYSPSLLTARVTNRVAESRTVSVTVSVNGTALGAAVNVTVPGNSDGYANFTWQPTATGTAEVTAALTGAPAGDNPDDNSLSLNLEVTDEHLPLILIDAGHGNLNASGREMRMFIDDLSAHHYNVLKNLDTLTASDLVTDVVKLLVITAPETAYSADELAAIGSFVRGGGSLWLLGLADYDGKQSWAPTVADRENAILNAIEGATGQQINMRMNDDEVIDANSNNGYVFGVIWSNFPGVATTGIGLNVESIASWSLNSLVDRNNTALTAEDGVTIVVQGDLDTGFGPSPYYNPNHTSNENADDLTDGYIYNPGWTRAAYPDSVPPDAIPVPMAAVYDVPGAAGRIMLYGDSNDPFTTFAYTAGDGRQNELFNLQSVMWLLGQPMQKSTIAQARAQATEDQPDKLNELVWVEGEITAAYGEFFNVLYVQDETGGITVHAPAGDIDPTEYARGTKVRVVGTVDIYNGDTEIQFFEAEMVQVLEVSSGEVAAKPFTTYQAALEANQGWLGVITGTVTAKTGLDTLIVDDGSGPVRAFLDGYNGEFSDIAVGNLVRVTGLLSEDENGGRIRVRNYKLHAPTIADDVVKLETTVVATKTITAPATVVSGDVVTYTLKLANTGANKAVVVTLSDTLPTGLTFQGFVSAGGATQANGVISWNGELAPGASVTVVFTAIVDKDFNLNSQTITNTLVYTTGNAGSGSQQAAFPLKALRKVYLPVMTTYK